MDINNKKKLNRHGAEDNQAQQQQRIQKVMRCIKDASNNTWGRDIPNHPDDLSLSKLACYQTRRASYNVHKHIKIIGHLM